MKLQIDTDTDTYRLLETAVWCLNKFFAVAQQDAVTSITSYYQLKNQEQYIDDDFYHYEGPYRIALRTYYISYLKHTSDRDDDFYRWAKEHNYYDPPREAAQYLMGNLEDD